MSTLVAEEDNIVVGEGNLVGYILPVEDGSLVGYIPQDIAVLDLID